MKTGVRRWMCGLLAILVTSTAWAHGSRRGHYPRSSVHLGVVIGDPWLFPPYTRFPSPVYWPRIYVPPVAPVAPIIVTSPPVYIEQQPAPAVSSALEPGYWYYCGEAQAYYPYVKECPGGWQKVPPSPVK